MPKPRKRPPDAPPPPETLSDELRAVKLLWEANWTPAEIARALRVTERTARRRLAELDRRRPALSASA